MVPDRQVGLAGNKEGGLSSAAFIHHQDHEEKLVENPPQRLNERSQFREAALCYLSENDQYWKYHHQLNTLNENALF